MNDLDLLRKAVDANVEDDAVVAAYVDALTEAGLEWEAKVWAAVLWVQRTCPTVDRRRLRTAEGFQEVLGLLWPAKRGELFRVWREATKLEGRR